MAYEVGLCCWRVRFLRLLRTLLSRVEPQSAQCKRAIHCLLVWRGLHPRFRDKSLFTSYGERQSARSPTHRQVVDNFVGRLFILVSRDLAVTVHFFWRGDREWFILIW